MNTHKTAFRLLVIGGSGFIGSRVVQTALARNIPVAYTYAHKQLALPASAFRIDFGGNFQDALHTCLTTFQPTTILHCALPDVYAAEITHRQISVESIRVVTRFLRQQELRCRLLYLSTNAVFAGEGPYIEDHPPDAHLRTDSFRAYAMTRAEGEKVVLNEWENSLVVRTSTVDGRAANGEFWPRLGNLLAQLRTGQSITRFRDRTILPTVVENLVDALLEVATPEFDERGILHVAGNQPITDFDYAHLLVRHLGLNEALVTGNSMADVPQMATTPRNIALDVSRAQSALKTKLLSVAEQLQVLFPDEQFPLYEKISGSSMPKRLP